MTHTYLFETTSTTGLIADGASDGMLDENDVGMNEGAGDTVGSSVGPEDGCGVILVN